MIIKNSSVFFRDSITDDWTKKDWALNLIPLGGIASVAYEIGSACLSSRDRTAKIAEDFFNSPIQTSLKKIAQCLWVPIVVCGTLKLVCLVVNVCWNRCFPPVKNRHREESQSIDPRSKDPCINIPPKAKDPCLIIAPKLVNCIFSYLNLHELGMSKTISKRWNQFAITPILWRLAIYREFAFSSKNWAQWDADLVKDVDIRQEILSLPKNIAQELRRSAFPGKSIRKTHVLVRMPKGLTIKKLGDLAKKYFPGNIDGNGYKSLKIVDGLGDKASEESIWLLMTKNVLSGSTDKSYIQQKNIVAELAKIIGVDIQVPTALEAVTCFFAEYSRSRKSLFYPGYYTRCQDNIPGYQILVGGFQPVCLSVDEGSYDCIIYDMFSHTIGVAEVLKLTLT